MMIGQAIIELTEVLKMNPDNIRALCNRFVAYFRISNYEKAIYDNNKAHKLLKDRIDDYYYKNIDFDSAIAELEAKEKLEPNNIEVKQTLLDLKDLKWFASGWMLGRVG